MIVNKFQSETLELLKHILRRICFPLGQLCVPFSLSFSAENVAVTIIEGYRHRTKNGRLIRPYIVYRQMLQILKNINENLIKYLNFCACELFSRAQLVYIYIYIYIYLRFVVLIDNFTNTNTLKDIRDYSRTVGPALSDRTSAMY
jgi:hypothetical protein